MRYRNFNVSIYCPVGNLLDITDFDAFEAQFKLAENNLKIGKVYLETFRGGVTISKEHMIKVRDYFLKKGIAVAGGITTEDRVDRKEGGFHPFCYSSPSTKELFQRVAALTAELFDEFILDDFYFTNCRCEHCIEAKGNRSWKDFRLALMQEFSEEVILKTAREINPKVKVIIKYPNWYDDYQETGYNLKEEPEVFDYIYTGTETRNPAYTQQHLPKYLSYFIMRYLENVAPGRNLGGWFDPYECTYNLTSYLEQGYLTLFGKAKEAMLFCLNSLIKNKATTAFIPAVGQLFTDVDRYFDRLGSPVGVSCYLPYHSSGENYLHDYIGMCGIPLEPYPDYPIHAKTVFLTESASCDAGIAGRMQDSLKQGADIIVTSGFVAKMGEDFKEFANVVYTNKKAIVNRYTYSADGGVTFSGLAEAAVPVLVPQLEYCTNDVWKIIGGFGEDNSFPVLLKTSYSNGRIFILTIPDDVGNLYNYPPAVMSVIRNTFCRELPVSFEGSSRITLYAYDNDTFILRSFLPYSDRVTVTVKKPEAVLQDLEDGRVYTGSTSDSVTKLQITAAPGVNYVFRIG
jgi:hypothetical protein